MLPLLQFPQLRRWQDWKDAPEQVREAQRTAWCEAADDVARILVSLASQPDSRNMDLLYEVAHEVNTIWSSKDLWNGKDRDAARVNRAAATLRRSLGKTGYDQVVLAWPFAEQVGWQLPDNSARAPVVQIWKALQSELYWSVVDHWWPYIRQRIERRSFAGWDDVRATIKSLNDLNYAWRLMPSKDRDFVQLDGHELARRVAPYKRHLLSADEMVELVRILQMRGRSIMRLRIGMLDVLHRPMLCSVRASVLRAAWTLPSEAQERFDKLLCRMWDGDGRGDAWGKVIRLTRRFAVGPEDIRVIHHGTEGAVFEIPKDCTNADAGRLLGHDLDWCTARKGDWVKTYAAAGPLYVLLTQSGARSQLHAESLQWVDDNNRRLLPERLSVFQPLVTASGLRLNIHLHPGTRRTSAQPRAYMDQRPDALPTLVLFWKSGLAAKPSDDEFGAWLDGVKIDKLSVMMVLDSLVDVAQLGVVVPARAIRRCVYIVTESSTCIFPELKWALDQLARAGADVKLALAGNLMSERVARFARFWRDSNGSSGRSDSA